MFIHPSSSSQTETRRLADNSRRHGRQRVVASLFSEIVRVGVRCVDDRLSPRPANGVARLRRCDVSSRSLKPSAGCHAHTPRPRPCSRPSAAAMLRFAVQPSRLPSGHHSPPTGVNFSCHSLTRYTGAQGRSRPFSAPAVLGPCFSTGDHANAPILVWISAATRRRTKPFCMKDESPVSYLGLGTLAPHGSLGSLVPVVLSEGRARLTPSTFPPETQETGLLNYCIRSSRIV